MTSPYDTYTSPLATRNASPEMLRLWSARHKFNTWRRIWLAVAEAMCEMGGAPSASSGASVRAPGGSRAASGVGGASADTGGAGDQPPAPAGGSDQSGPGRSGGRVLVTREQVEELRAVVERKNPDGTVGITDDEIRLAEKYERELRHDVMAHVHALGDACPKARAIIHLGMTSQDVVCNADWHSLDRSLDLIMTKVRRAVNDLGAAAAKHQRKPALGFTHFQPAQPVTVGRRFAQWAYELWLNLKPLDAARLVNRPKGLRGATGTQASYMALLESEPDPGAFEGYTTGWRPMTGGAFLGPMQWVLPEEKLEHMVGLHLRWDDYNCDFGTYGFDRVTHTIVSQTYPRVVDVHILNALASTASVLHKIATDIRLLSNRKELDEPFEDKQIGSSAMPYKRNPMRCERICGLTRFVMNLVGNAYDTAATQWLERTLDDSSNRRLSLPEAFLALDGALDLMHNVASGLIVHEAMVRKNLMAELPFMATENILMACVRAGGDRQEYHEIIRVHAQAAGMRVKQEGLDNDLLERLKADRAFWGKSRGGRLEHELDWSEGPGGLLDPMRYVGRSVEQTERFIREVVEPLREQYKDAMEGLGGSWPRV